MRVPQLQIGDRFREAAVSLVAKDQDYALLVQQCGQQEAQLQEARGALIEGQGVVLALLESAATAPGLDEALAERARRWLAAIAEGG